MAGRQSRGRQKIPMRLIENQDDLYASFSKRRCGLYKKASELSTLCGAEVGIIIFSPTGNPFSFWHPSMEVVIHRYRHPNQPLDDHTRAVAANTRERIENLNRRLDEVLDEYKQTKAQLKQVEEVEKTREKMWWEQTALESLNKEQLSEWKAWFEDFNSKVKKRIEELRIQASISMATNPSTFPHNYPLGPSYAPTMGMIGPSQVPSHYHNVPPQAQLPFDQGPLAAGGNNFWQFPGQLNYFPPQSQDPWSSGTRTREAFIVGLREPFTNLGAGEPSTSRGGGESSTRAGIGSSCLWDTNP